MGNVSDAGVVLNLKMTSAALTMDGLSHVTGQALTLDPSSPYNIHCPVRRGRLNLHPGPGGSLTAVVADLRLIWLHCIERLLGIERADLEVGQQPVDRVWVMIGSAPHSLGWLAYLYSNVLECGDGRNVLVTIWSFMNSLGGTIY